VTSVTAGTTSANGTAITGQYGTLTIGADGSYSYMLDNNNPAVNALQTGQTLSEQFTYTLKDPANATDIAQLTITINGITDGGALAVTAVDGNAGADGHATVYEKGLGKPGDTTETTTGTIIVTAPRWPAKGRNRRDRVHGGATDRFYDQRPFDGHRHR